MGNSQSNSSEAVDQKELVEQLTALHLKNRVREQGLEKEYIHIDLIESAPVDREGSQTVSISAAEQWEKELLADPKNRYESPCLRLKYSYTDLMIGTNVSNSRADMWNQIGTLCSPLQPASVYYLPESRNPCR